MDNYGSYDLHNVDGNNKVANGDSGLTPVENDGSYQQKNGGATVLVAEEDGELRKGDSECCLQCCAPEGRPLWVFLKLGVCVLAGIVFGLALEKTRGKQE
jgi:hypothetical protein